MRSLPTMAAARRSGLARRPSSRPTGARAPARRVSAAASKPGVKWDAFKQIWVRDDSGGFSIEDYDETQGDYVIWPVIHTYLDSKKLKTVSAAEAEKLVAKGATVVDVRAEKQFNAGHVEGAVNVELYPALKPKSSKDFAKVGAAFFMGMQATARNLTFAEDVEKAVPKGKRGKVIVACSTGGSMKTVVKARRGDFYDKERSFGRESRSLKAAYELMTNGFRDVVHLEDGYGGWRVAGKPLVRD